MQQANSNIFKFKQKSFMLKINWILNQFFHGDNWDNKISTILRMQNVIYD